jgi:hypothetical protein
LIDSISEAAFEVIIEDVTETFVEIVAKNVAETGKKTTSVVILKLLLFLF